MEMLVGRNGCVGAAARGEGCGSNGLVSGCAGQSQSASPQDEVSRDSERKTNRNGNVIANLLAMNKLR